MLLFCEFFFAIVSWTLLNWFCAGFSIFSYFMMCPREVVCGVRKSEFNVIVHGGVESESDSEVESDSDGDGMDEDLEGLCLLLLMYVLILLFYFSFYLLEDHLACLAQENGRLLLKSLYSGVSLMVSKEEEVLCAKFFDAKSRELCARALMVSEVSGGDWHTGLNVVATEVGRLVGVSQLYGFRLNELSDLQSVVMEMQVLETNSSEITDFSPVELQDFCEKLELDLDTVVSDWGGECSV